MWVGMARASPAPPAPRWRHVRATTPDRAGFVARGVRDASPLPSHIPEERAMAQNERQRQAKLARKTAKRKQHVQAILKEFGATNRLQAVIFAYRSGILSSGVDADPTMSAKAEWLVSKS